MAPFVDQTIVELLPTITYCFNRLSAMADIVIVAVVINVSLLMLNFFMVFHQQ